MTDPTAPAQGAQSITPDESRYGLLINGIEWSTGSLQVIQAHMMEVVTTHLAGNPEGLAQDAAQLNRDFSTGAVKRDLHAKGSWFFLFGAHTTNPLRIRILKERDA